MEGKLKGIAGDEATRTSPCSKSPALKGIAGDEVMWAIEIFIALLFISGLFYLFGINDDESIAQMMGFVTNLLGKIVAGVLSGAWDIVRELL